MNNKYKFTGDIFSWLGEPKPEEPKEGLFSPKSGKPEAPVAVDPARDMAQMAVAALGGEDAARKAMLNPTTLGPNDYSDLDDWTVSTVPFLPQYRGDVPAYMALEIPPVTTTDLGPDMDTMAMQDAQEQAAIRSASGITESLGRPAPAGLMSPPVQDTVSGVGSEDTVATYSETTDVEGLEGPEAISSAVVQSLKKQTDTVSRGDKGNTVLNAQLRLAELGYEIGRGGTSGLSKNKQGKWVSLDNSQLRGVDSDFGPSTQKAVKDFQEDAGLPITGEIDAATATALATKEPVAFRVPENLTKNFSTAQTSNFNAAKDAAEKEGLKGAELASFMSQVAHESDSFRTAKEYASGSAYEGRSDLGNTQAGDGVRYKGRGYIQLTGRSNYEKAGKALGLDLLNNPSLAEEPKNAAAVSLWFWKTQVKPQVPDFMDTERVTKVVNGGFNGLKDRKKYFEKFTKKWSDDK